MEQASPIVSDTAIVRCCNNVYKRRKVKEAKSRHNHNPLENTDIQNPTKKMETSGGDELPVDIVYNILSRMPIKSLARFQCVSKVWCKYINDPYFEIIMHNAKRADMKDDPTMLMIFELDRYPYAYASASASLTMLVTKEEEEEKSGATSHEEVVITTKKNPRTPPYMEFVCKDWGCRYLVEGEIILGSCKGLIFSSQDNNVDDGTTVLLVINPLKKVCYKLPPIKIWSCNISVFEERESSGLGYDASTNTYKMVCVVLRNQQKKIGSYHRHDDVVKEDLCTMVHDVVLGATANSSLSSWREIPAVPAYPISGEAVFANGCLHWLVSHSLKYWPLDALRKVICFDMTKEEFGLIDPPAYNTRIHNRCTERLVDLDGQVGVVYDDDISTRHTSSIEVWLLNHKTKCWVLHCRLDKKPPLRHDTFIKVIGYWNKDACDLLITDGCRKRLYIYRLKQGVLHEINFNYWGYSITTDIRLYQATFSSILRRSINI
ncbi:F-box protein At2g23160-like isoform X2 [Rutidosis leptorrhynchoides]|uniref:F-box protein At2g23160-like isoform X2 n=1 Tax=Rutidosis leptorrhynchoides TaxID=125765 RepID=UPI003A9A19D7